MARGRQCRREPVVFGDFMDAVKVLGQFRVVINIPPPA